MTEAMLPPEFFNRAMLTCEATVGGERIRAEVFVIEAVLNDPAAVKAVETSLRQALMMKILEKWTPVIEIHR